MAEEEFDIEDDLGDDFDDEFDDDAPQASATPAKSSFLTRRRLIVGGVLGVVLIVGGFLLFSSGDSSPKPTSNSSITTVSTPEPPKEEKKKKKKKIKYEELFSQLEPEQTTKILKELTFAGVRYKTEQNGKKFNVLVDRDEIEEARNLLAIKGLPSGSIQGYELLDDGATLGVTEFDKRVRFLRALSGELEKGILQFEMIENAKVQIVLPEQRLFAVTQPPVTASILIRRKDGSDITDEVVFSIIQLVANAVENLQPENVSVIDTQGKVLSQGIFERIAAREAGLFEEEEEEVLPELDVLQKEDAMGHPIIPNYQSIDQWFDLKWEFEKELEDKAMRQLMGILPLGGYKVAVSSDIGPIGEGNSIDVKRLTISIVVDGMNDDIFLDADTKTQIFSTVAGAVGYIRGRDSIQLSRADFTLFTPEELAELERLKPSSFPIFKWIGAGFGLLALGGSGYFLFSFIRRKRIEAKQRKELMTEGRDTDFTSLQDELNDEKNVEKLRALANEEPELIAQIMENWLEISDTKEESDFLDSVEDSREVTANDS